MLESNSVSSIQEFLVSYLDEKLPGLRQQGLLAIGSDHDWKLTRLDPNGKGETVFSLPAGDAWKRLEELDATNAIWDTTQGDSILVNQ